ncbi:MAG: D-alanine--D-alanine ligase [Gemmatimonadota bacterium]|nr:D-alanine--D-alanine ligase [Gemmatimonadota bacterium]
MKVIILAGGESAEREVSLVSARYVAQALSRKGSYQVTLIDPGLGWQRIDPEGNTTRQALGASCGLPPERCRGLFSEADIVFSVLHGGQGEDGMIHSVLELLGVPYAGSPPGPSAAAMDKITAKRLFSSVGIPTPGCIVLEEHVKSSWPGAVEQAVAEFGLPLVVKPPTQGSTVGLSMAGSVKQALEAVDLAAGYGPQVLLERFIQGRELTVGILGREPLPVLEIVVPGGFYDFKAKYQSHDNQYICPAEIGPAIARQAQEMALRAFDVLGLKDYSRIDFRLDEDGGLWCIEANNQPGMTDASLFPKAAAVAGLDLTAVLERIISCALERRAGEN